MPTRLIGVLPCAGNQTRMNELEFAKELLPLFDGRPVIKHSIDTLRQATSYLLAVVHPKKASLMDYLKKQHIPYIKLDNSTGPIHTLKVAAQHSGSDILFSLTDTFYQPTNVFSLLAHHHHKNVIGLFRSDTPEKFDSVKMDNELITDYAVKIDPPLSNWTMGCGKIANSSFKYIKPGNDELIFSHIFKPLVKAQTLYGLKFKNSVFYDLGTPENYISYLMKRHMKK